jgi:hypothetical protein
MKRTPATREIFSRARALRAGGKRLRWRVRLALSREPNSILILRPKTSPWAKFDRLSFADDGSSGMGVALSVPWLPEGKVFVARDGAAPVLGSVGLWRFPVNQPSDFLLREAVPLPAGIQVGQLYFRLASC